MSIAEIIEKFEYFCDDHFDEPVTLEMLTAVEDAIIILKEAEKCQQQ